MTRGPQPPIPLTRPWFDAAEPARVSEALSGPVAGDGPFCRRVEARLEALLGAGRVLLTTSGTHALELALLALGVGPGQEVICPSFTFPSTANAALRVGARPVLADIEPTFLGLDPDDAERRLSPRTAAVIPAHYAGYAADMDGVLDLARRRGLHVIEDAAQALGSSFRGAALGTLGAAGCLSFHETKNLTCGEGGALALRDAEAARRAEVMREKGTNRSAFLRGEVARYSWLSEGSSYVLSDVLAALLHAQLDKRDAIQARRAAAEHRYREALSAWAAEHGVRLPPGPDAERRGNHHSFHLLYPDEAARDRALASLRARGVQAAFHYVPLHASPFGAAFAGGGRFPVAERVAATLLRLPLHPLLSEDDLGRVIDATLASLG